MQKSYLFLGVFFLISVLAAELPPYLPPPHSFQRVKTTAASDISLPGGGKIGDFIVKRSLNGEWKFSGLETSASPIIQDSVQEQKYAEPSFDVSSWDNIPVPLNWYVRYPNKQTIQAPYARGYYRTEFELSEADLHKRRIILEFDVIGYDAKIFLNGMEIGSHHGDFTPFKFDATKAAKAGKNVLAVRVITDNGPIFGAQRPVTHTYGSQWAIFNIKGGIWQDVWLAIEPQLRIDRLIVTPDLPQNSISVDCRIINPADADINVDLHGLVVSAMAEESITAGSSADNKMILKPGVNDVAFVISLKDPQKWSVYAPYLYHLVLTVNVDGKTVSANSVRFGYRDFKCENGKFYLNGEEIYLFGENISSVNYGGNGLPPEEMTKKLEKYILDCRNVGYVILRNAHMPIVPAALDIADECGMMIYNEWAWCFSSNINADAFAEINSKELTEFFYASTNHPSVVMWSLGNEVVHRDLPLVAREMDRQVNLIRSLDKQKRPVCTFSGNAGWSYYGRTRLDTDILDLHSYISLHIPWTKLMDELKTIYDGNLQIYNEKDRLSRAFVAWENVGFSWGYFIDENYKPGTVEAYAAYAVKPSNWGVPNGVGFTGAVPLWKALQAGFPEWAMARYGRRIFELYRLDDRFSGFAPWFLWPLPVAQLWNQLVLPSIHSDNYLFPRNLFAGGENDWNLAIINSGNDSFDGLIFEVEMVAETGGEKIEIASFPIEKLAPQQRLRKKIKLAIPQKLETGHYQMRLTIRKDGKDLSRNFYDTYVENIEILTRQVSIERNIFVYDTGAEKNIVRLEKILQDHQVPFARVKSPKEVPDWGLLVVPAEIDEQHSLTLGNDPALSEFTWTRGGTLLMLAQKSLSSPFPGGEILDRNGNSFVDLVIPDHPVFNGLDYRCFDTWNNPENGFVVSANYQPFTLNAVAVKGPMLGQQGVGMALVEAVDGKGRIILSQFNASACRELDSAAARYLYNLLSYAAGREYWKNAKALVDVTSADYSAEEDRLFYIDLTSKANRSFSDEVENDGKGGWTDQGKNDFRMMPTGIQKAAGITFKIIDPEKNNDKSCLIVHGSERPNFPVAILGIDVKQKLSRLFFLHTAAWGNMGKSGAYRIHHSDGTFTDYRLEGGYNIGDWWWPARFPGAKLGILRKNAMNHEVGTFVTEWENPKPHLEITSVDFLSEAKLQEAAVNYLPTATPVPILIAITGEKTEKSVRITGDRFKGAVGVMETGSKIPAEVEIKKENDEATLKISFKESSIYEIPAVIIFYKKENSQGDYRYLTFQVKSQGGGTIQLLLPQTDMKAMLKGEVTLTGSGQWRKYRLKIGEHLKNENGFSFEHQRGELFMYYRSTRAPEAARAALEFEIKDIVLE